MASLFQRPGSDKWWIRYTRDGQQFRKSTGTTDKNQALLQLREIELVLGHKITSNTVSQALVKTIQHETIRTMPLHTYFEERRKHVASKTQATYASRDRIFIDWLHAHYPAVTLISEVERGMFREFLAGIAETASSRTRNGYLRRLRSVFRAAVQDGYAVYDPTEGIAFERENGSNRRAYTEEELRKLFDATAGEVRLLATLGLYAGAMRMSDIINLRWSNIDLKKDTIRWRMSKRHGKPMEIAIHPRLRTELMKVQDRHGNKPVLPRFYENTDRASEAFRQALVKAGLKEDTRPAINKRHAERKQQRALAEQEGRNYEPEPVKRPKHELDFHSLRYNFVSILKNNGCPEAIARSIMGHSSVEVSAIYTQIDDESERKWVSSLPDVVSGKS